MKQISVLLAVFVLCGCWEEVEGFCLSDGDCPPSKPFCDLEGRFALEQGKRTCVARPVEGQDFGVDAGGTDAGPLDLGVLDLGPERYALTVRLLGDGEGVVLALPDRRIDCPGTCSIETQPGEMISLVAQENRDTSTFSGWGGECSGDGECVVEILGDLEVTATFQRKGFSLSVALEGDGAGSVRSQGNAQINCGAGEMTCEASFLEGATVTLQASPSMGSEFGGWGGACSGLNPLCTLQIDEAKAVRASFVAEREDLTITIAGEGAVVSDDGLIRCDQSECLVQLPVGSVLNLQAEESRHSRFVDWSGNCSGAADCSLDLSSPMQVTAQFEVRPSIAVGASHSCGVLSTGALHCWGNGNFGKLGYGSESNVGDGVGPSIVAAGAVPVGALVKQVALGGFHTCALLLDGGVRCWGEGSFGRLGYNNQISVADGVGPPIGGAGNVSVGAAVAKIAAGGAHTCALLESGSVRCWGLGDRGQLGYNAPTNVGDGVGSAIIEAGDVPVGEQVIDIACGEFHTCALLQSGALRCWGFGASGRLGYGNTNNVGDGSGASIQAAGNVPVGASVIQIAAGATHTCAVRTNNTVRCWGSGTDGRLGYGSTDNVGDGMGLSIQAAGDVPVGMGVVEVVTAAAHTCGRSGIGLLKCWGSGLHGRLGQNSVADIGDGFGAQLVQVSTLVLGTSAGSLSSGAEASHTCITTEADQFRCWGIGTSGRLGYGSEANVGDGVGLTLQQAGDVPF